MTNELSNLQQQIQQALQLLQESKVFAPAQENETRGVLPPADIFFAEHGSLLERCTQVCAQYQNQKPTIRIIHHLACTGGTLISKCLSVMPNTYLLSEVHPYTDLHLGRGKPKFLPADIASLSKHARIPGINVLLEKLFLHSITTTSKHVSSYGGALILREHTHSDFHVGTEAANTPSIVNLLSDHFVIKSILTFRDPIDSYLSLQLNGWVHFIPGTFEEYCARILKMLQMYKNIDVFHYEDFIKFPGPTLEKICIGLDIPYNEHWKYYFDVAQVTGDSGRSSPIIEVRPRRDLSPALQADVASSESYMKIRKLLY